MTSYAHPGKVIHAPEIEKPAALAETPQVRNVPTASLNVGHYGYVSNIDSELFNNNPEHPVGHDQGSAVVQEHLNQWMAGQAMTVLGGATIVSSFQQLNQAKGQVTKLVADPGFRGLVGKLFTAAWGSPEKRVAASKVLREAAKNLTSLNEDRTALMTAITNLEKTVANFKPGATLAAAKAAGTSLTDLAKAKGAVTELVEDPNFRGKVARLFASAHENPESQQLAAAAVRAAATNLKGVDQAALEKAINQLDALVTSYLSKRTR